MFGPRSPLLPRFLMKVAVVSATLVTLYTFSSASRTNELLKLEIADSRGIYRITAVTLLDAPAKHVRSALNDLVHIYRINPLVTESEILPSPDRESVRVRTHIVACVAFFCNQIERVEDVRELPSGNLQSVVVPELSNFRSGNAEWRIESLGDRTRLVYQAQMEPDFFIPPLIGSYFVKQKLAESVATSFANLERIASIFANRHTRYKMLVANVRIDPDVQTPSVSFKRDVYPVLERNCITCHRPPDGKGYQKTGLNMETYHDLMKGTLFGPVITPGDSRRSILNMLVEGRAGVSMRMPHKRDTPLTDKEIAILRLWVDQGARNN
jgi:hypothetical protein